MAKKESRPRPSKKERLAAAQAVTLTQFFNTVREMDAAGDQDGEAAAPRGACLLKNPLTGESFCIQTTRDACKALKGAFIDGPCGG
jgi:hypothetical protein